VSKLGAIRRAQARTREEAREPIANHFKKDSNKDYQVNRFVVKTANFSFLNVLLLHFFSSVNNYCDVLVLCQFILFADVWIEN
jgi:hypothetical protein